jgi:hypothetical protein
MKKRVRQVAELASSAFKGETTDRSRLERYRQRYAELTPDQRLELFHWLSDEFEVNLQQIEEPLAKVRSASELDRAAS